MDKLIIYQYDKDVEFYITKDIIVKELWLLLYEYIGYNGYFIYSPTQSKSKRPWFMFGKYYTFKYLEQLEGINKPYPHRKILEYFQENNIIITEKFML